MNIDAMHAQIEKRIQQFKTIMEYGQLANGKISCLDQVRKKVTNNISVHKRIGSSSVNGEAYLGDILACPPHMGPICSPDPLAVKLVPLKPEDVPYIKDHMNNPRAWKNSLWAELLYMQICSFVVRMAKIPNLPIAFSYMFCPSCQFENENLNRMLPKNTPCLLLLNEFASGGDFATWLREPHSLKTWSIAYFQIFTALYFLQKFFNMTHHDMHWGNVLVHPAESGGYSAYKIDGKTYYIPNIGYNFVLWDFGNARIPGKVEISNLKDYYSLPVNGQIPRLLVDYFRIAQAPLWMKDPSNPDYEKYKNVPLPKELQTDFLETLHQLFYEGSTLKRVIPKLWGVYQRKPETGIIIERYDLDSPFKNFPKEHVFLLHDFITNPIPEKVPLAPELALNAQELYSTQGSMRLSTDDKGDLRIEEAPRDYEYYDPMDIDE